LFLTAQSMDDEIVADGIQSVLAWHGTAIQVTGVLGVHERHPSIRGQLVPALLK